ncbi:AhpA/YtjB family protein [Glaciecola petra]|uniref:AhpA/YtjB family protein n=1 Tax=Glaciecola petra TaxID=3075602 RepID=A0ABU2ZT36_9ALTE|nr:AhpA/YtjB family protein [Aestuariibacter sp. P117]MDT0595803.1 AhpA/YtjB family protein [Aestuariibacter sp. P117]
MEQTHNYSIFKRISTLILIVLSVVVAINLYLMHVNNAQQWYQVESEQLGRSLTVQASKLLAAPLANNNQALLSEYIELINQGNFVKGAVMFDQMGIKYAQQQDPLSVVELVRQKDVEPLVFVEDIVFNGEIIGYIKLILDKQAITEHHQLFNQNQLQQSLLIIVLTIIVSGLIIRLFYKARENFRIANRSDNLS